MEATTLNPLHGRSAISLAKLIAERKGLGELVEPEVPSRVELPQPPSPGQRGLGPERLGY
jgi:hypothetical protein